MKQYRAINGNGGDYHLITFDVNGKPDFYVYTMDDMQFAGWVNEIKNGADPVADRWEGNAFDYCDGCNPDYCLSDGQTPEGWYNDMCGSGIWCDELRRSGGWTEYTEE